MRTEADLHEAFRTLERRADEYGTPAFRPLPDAPRSSAAPRARLAVSMLAAAAAVAAVVGLAAAVVDRSDRAPQRPERVVPAGSSPVPSTSVPGVPSSPASGVAAPRSFPLDRLWFSRDRMNGVEQRGMVLLPLVQQVQLDTADGRQHWNLALNAAGAWRPVRPAGATGLTVAGRPGFYGQLADLPIGVRDERPYGLAWEYAPGAWATVVSADAEAISRDVAAAVAGSVHPGVSTPVLLPLRVETAPAGMRLDGFLSGSRVAGRAQPDPTTTVDFTASGTGTDFSIDLDQRLPGEQFPGQRTTLAGHEAVVTDRLVTIFVGDTWVIRLGEVLGASATPRLNPEQLLAVARGIGVAPRVGDPTTWFDATTALP